MKKGGQLMGADFLLVDEKSTPVTSSLTTPVNVCVSLFDGLAFAFHSKLDSYGSEPKVLVFTSINPQLVGGRLFVNGTSGTHLYFDTEQLPE